MGEELVPWEWCHPCYGDLRFYRQANWMNQDEQTSKQHSFIVSASVPTFRFMLSWSSCPGLIQWWTTTWKNKQNKPSAPQLAFWSLYFTLAREISRHTDLKFTLTLNLHWPACLWLPSGRVIRVCYHACLESTCNKNVYSGIVWR